jgi:hypothetical protein
MAKSTYPTAAELETSLLAAGLTQELVDALDLTTAALAGRETFEGMTGRRMLATTQTREYDPRRISPRGVLDLRTDLVAATSVTYGTQAFTVGTDVRMAPLNAADDGRPYGWLEFGYWQFYPYGGYGFPLPTLITVVGSWGYGATIPENAWQAMMMEAALSLFPTISAFLTAGMVGWDEADMQEQYGQDPFGAYRKNLQMVLGSVDIPGVVNLYRRPVMG